MNHCPWEESAEIIPKKCQFFIFLSSSLVANMLHCNLLQSVDAMLDRNFFFNFFFFFFFFFVVVTLSRFSCKMVVKVVVHIPDS